MEDAKPSKETTVASRAERAENEWVQAQPAHPNRAGAIQASVTTEQALLDAYPGNAESLATLAATLGIAWSLADIADTDE